MSFNVVYDVSGDATGEQTVDAKIDGPAIFEGQSRTQTTTTVSLTTSVLGETFTLSSVIKSYETGNGTFITSYGEVSTGTSTVPVLGTTNSAGKDVNNPPFEDRIYTLALGQSITQTDTVISTTTLPSPSGPTTNATVSTTRYAANETITVLGKSYDTCKYEVFDISAPTELTTLWYIVGKGIPAKIGTSADGLVFQLKSGTYKGSPL